MSLELKNVMQHDTWQYLEDELKADHGETTNVFAKLTTIILCYCNS